MIKSTIKLLCLVLVVFATSCDTKKIETSRQLFAKEQERLTTFLNTIPADSVESNPDKLTYKQLWTAQAVDTVDQSKGSGLIYFENVTGTGAQVTPGAQVGFRYKRWSIDADQEGKVRMKYIETNYNQMDAEYFVYGANTQGVPMGIQLAAQYMRKYGKSRIVVPSTLGGGNYRTSIFEIEITFLEE